MAAPALESSPPTSESASATPLLSQADLPWLTLAVLIAVALRILWIAQVNVDPNDGRFADAVFFHNVGRLLADGWGYVDPYTRTATAQWPPGYPAALAALYKLFGFHLVLAKGLNIFFAAVTVTFVYLIGLRAFDRRVAYIGALIFALFPGQIYFSTVVMTETMFAAVFMLVLLLALVWTTDRLDARWWQLLLIGLLIGVAAMVRAEGLFLAAILVALWLLLVRPWRRMARYCVMLALGTVLALTPWTVRNAIEFHEFIPLRPNAVQVLALGLDQEAVAPPIFEGIRVTFSEGLEYQITHPWQIPELMSRRIVRLYKTDADAMRFIRDPGIFMVEQLPVEGSDDVLLDFRARESSDGPAKRYLSNQERALWRGLADRYFFAVGAAALVAAAVGLVRRQRGILLLILAVLGWTLLFGLIPPSPRFHHPVGPVIAILAGAFLVFVWDAALVARLRLVGPSREVRAGLASAEEQEDEAS